jgi:hypothetical protein
MLFIFTLIFANEIFALSSTNLYPLLIRIQTQRLENIRYLMQLLRLIIQQPSSPIKKALTFSSIHIDAFTQEAAKQIGVPKDQFWDAMLNPEQSNACAKTNGVFQCGGIDKTVKVDWGAPIERYKAWLEEYESGFVQEKGISLCSGEKLKGKDGSKLNWQDLLKNILT